MITEPCVDKKYFINRKFKEIEHNVFEREERKEFLNQLNGLKEAITRTVQFRILGVDPDLGTNLEIRIDGKFDNHPLHFGSGYWLDRADFETTFKDL